MPGPMGQLPRARLSYKRHQPSNHQVVICQPHFIDEDPRRGEATHIACPWSKASARAESGPRAEAKSAFTTTLPSCLPGGHKDTGFEPESASWS